LYHPEAQLLFDMSFQVQDVGERVGYRDRPFIIASLVFSSQFVRNVQLMKSCTNIKVISFLQPLFALT